MRLLLDTNIYVYMVSDRKSLTKGVCAYLEDPENLKYLSIVSLQELITAFRTKKLLSNLWKTEAEMISFVLNDPSVEIDNTDVNVIRTLVTHSRWNMRATLAFVCWQITSSATP